jgi:hypothetical protein
VFADTVLRSELTGIREEADLSCTPSLLRTLDVIVWMRRYGHKDSSDLGLRNRQFNEITTGNSEPDADERLADDPPQPVVTFPFSVGRSFLARGEITLPVHFNRMLGERLHGRGPSWKSRVESAQYRTVGSLRRGHTGGNRYYQIRVPPDSMRELVGPVQLGQLLMVEVQLSPSLRIVIVPRGVSMPTAIKPG